MAVSTPWTNGVSFAEELPLVAPFLTLYHTGLSRRVCSAAVSIAVFYHGTILY